VSAEDLARLLDELGQRLGPTGAHVFELAVWYKVTDALVGMVFGILLALLPWLLVRYVRGRIDDHDDREFATTIAFVLAVACTVGGAMLVASDIITFLNPEYAALRDIVRTIKP
jgi:predicted PurR-regulated permease PerM